MYQSRERTTFVSQKSTYLAGSVTNFQVGVAIVRVCSGSSPVDEKIMINK